MTPRELIELAREMKLVRIFWSELSGEGGSLTLPSEALTEAAFLEGVSCGWEERLLPQAAGAFSDPFCDLPTLVLWGQKETPSDPRAIARRAEESLAGSGLADAALFEGELALRFLSEGGEPLASGLADLCAEALLSALDAGVGLSGFRTGAAPGRTTFTLEPRTLLGFCDGLLTFLHHAQGVAASSGASVAPEGLLELRLSLLKEARPLMQEQMRHALGGTLARLRPLCALGVRDVVAGGERLRVDARLSPHALLAAWTLAAREGIESQREPGDAPPDLPATPQEMRDALEGDHLFLLADGVFPRQAVEGLIGLRRRELLERA